VPFERYDGVRVPLIEPFRDRSKVSRTIERDPETDVFTRRLVSYCEKLVGAPFER
jgi:hypothetical protein